jgi:apolipoprotein N-acyltransferase
LLFEKPNKKYIAINLIGLLIFISFFIYGSIYIKNYKYKPIGLKTLVVQPSLKTPFMQTSGQKIYQDYYEKTLGAIHLNGADFDFISWGESAIAADLNKSEDLQYDVSRIIPQNTYLLSGTIGSNTKNKSYNSIDLINDKGQVVNRYNKIHLVVLGEYLPFYQWINWTKIIGFESPFLPGKKHQNFTIKDKKFSPLVCYDVIFPKVYDKANKPDFLFQVSNDSYYGISSGPIQHFYIARIQAIANNMPVLRIGNDGISGVILPTGEILHQFKLKEQESGIWSF